MARRDVALGGRVRRSGGCLDAPAVAPTGALKVVVLHGRRAGLTAAAGAHMIVCDARHQPR
jgi:hypothetical protein